MRHPMRRNDRLAWGTAFSPEAYLECFNIEVGLGQQLLEPSVLDLKDTQAPGLVGLHAPYLVRHL
jgi:hypothetical protein